MLGTDRVRTPTGCAVAACAVACCAGPAAATEEPELTWRMGERWSWTLERDVDTVYPVYLADPRRPHTALGLLFATESQLPASGDSRFALDIGGRYPVVRFERVDGLRVQVYGEAGFFGQFDRLNSLDEIGWDGWYAVQTGIDPGGPLRLKVGLRHLSSHLGDEFVIRTGRRRIDYTREDLSLAVAWTRDGVALYADGGVAFARSFPDQEPLVVQAGAQYVSPPRWGPIGWYAGVDAKAFQEDSWDPSVCLEIGLALPLARSGPTWRLGLEGYAGRAILGEFSRFEEDYIALSLGIDP